MLPAQPAVGSLLGLYFFSGEKENYFPYLFLRNEDQIVRSTFASAYSTRHAAGMDLLLI
jgi:hypothetical protein